MRGLVPRFPVLVERRQIHPSIIFFYPGSTPLLVHTIKPPILSPRRLLAQRCSPGTDGIVTMPSDDTSTKVQARGYLILSPPSSAYPPDAKPSPVASALAAQASCRDGQGRAATAGHDGDTGRCHASTRAQGRERTRTRRALPLSPVRSRTRNAVTAVGIAPATLGCGRECTAGWGSGTREKKNERIERMVDTGRYERHELPEDEGWETSA